MNLRATTLSLLFAASAVACSGTSPVRYDGELERLTAARATWASAVEEASGYRFTLTMQCFCTPEMAGPFAVRVSDGVVQVTRDAAVVEERWLEGLPLTAEALFAFVEERIGEEDFRADFDPRTGLPVSVYSDPIPEAADDELGLLIETIVIEP